MGLALSGAAALFYGLTHFLNGAISRSHSGFAVAAVAQIGGTLIILLPTPFYPASEVTASSLMWGAVSGVGSASLAYLYRGMSRGKISIVAPVSEVSASGFSVVFGIAMGERLGPLRSLGVLLSFPAIWLASRTPPIEQGKTPAEGKKGRVKESGPLEKEIQPKYRGMRLLRANGVIDGLIGGAGVAVTWIALSRVPEEAGLWPMAISRVVSLASLCLLARGMGVSLHMPLRVALLAGVSGAFGTVATTLYMYATQHQLMAIASVVTALYPAITVLLALSFLKERLNAVQATGLILAGASLTVIAVT